MADNAHNVFKKTLNSVISLQGIELSTAISTQP